MADDEQEFLEVTTAPFNIPVGSVPTCTISILAFIAPDGSYGYAVRQGGTGYLTEYLGLIEIAKNEFLKPSDD